MWSHKLYSSVGPSLDKKDTSRATGKGSYMAVGEEKQDPLHFFLCHLREAWASLGVVHHYSSPPQASSSPLACSSLEAASLVLLL